MTDLGDKLQKALEAANNVNTYIWKGPKTNGIQKEYKLIDCSQDELQSYYNHAYEMLYNKNTRNPGRITLLGIIDDQIQRCRAELLIRWLRSERKYTNTKCLEAIKNIISQNKDTITSDQLKTYPIGQIMGGIPIDYEEVPIGLVMDACMDYLGTYDNSHLTLNFIIRLGVWFTQKEMQTPYPEGLYKKDPITGKAMNRLNLIKKELNLNPNTNLIINDKGLSYSEFKSMCRLCRTKYSLLTSDQLKLLSSKILYRFQDQCEMQAKQWQDKINEILEVAAHKGYALIENSNE